MKSKITIFILVLLSSFLVAPCVFAQDHPDYKMGKEDHSKWDHEKFEKKIQEIYGQLNLSSEQKKQLDENKQKHRDNMKSSFEKMHSLRQEMRQELTKSELDMNKINGLQSQMKSLQSEMIDRRLESILDVRKILTPEQFAKFNALMEEHRNKNKKSHSKDK